MLQISNFRILYSGWLDEAYFFFLRWLDKKTYFFKNIQINGGVDILNENSSSGHTDSFCPGNRLSSFVYSEWKFDLRIFFKRDHPILWFIYLDS